jgi:hypothetical protein
VDIISREEQGRSKKRRERESHNKRIYMSRGNRTTISPDGKAGGTMLKQGRAERSLYISDTTHGSYGGKDRGLYCGDEV